MTPTLRKIQKVVIKREPLSFGNPNGNTGFSNTVQGTPFIQSSQLGDLGIWQKNTMAWEEDAAWQAQRRSEAAQKSKEKQYKGRKWRKHRG
jgi:hypothetical protein